ncbi:MAG: hypothetical protein WCK05_12175 [Planctomycetota bacterium]
MKKWLTIVVAVSVVAVLLFGVERTWSYLVTTRTSIQDGVDQNTPMSFEAARIKNLIQGKSEEILQYEDKVADLQGRADATTRAVADTGRKLEAERGLLAKIKGMLDSKQTRYTVGSGNYSYAEVNTDALARVDACKRMQEDISEQSSMLKELQKSVSQGQASAQDARRKLGELSASLARLEARNTNADIRTELAQITSSLSSSPTGQNSELEKACRNYERRVAVKERRASAKLTSSTATTIDYSKTVVTQDAATEIDRLLNPPQSEAEPPAATRPAENPSAATPGK